MRINMSLEQIIENAKKQIYLDKDFECSIYSTKEEFMEEIGYQERVLDNLKIHKFIW